MSFSCFEGLFYHSYCPLWSRGGGSSRICLTKSARPKRENRAILYAQLGIQSILRGESRDRNRFPFETPSDVLPDHDPRLCGCHPSGCAGADAAHRRRKPHMDAVSRGAVHLYLCGLRDGAGGAGHRQLLVRLRSDRDPAADPDRRLRRHHRRRNVSDALR